MTTIGHELGHYVLQHILKGLAFGALLLLLGLLLLFYLMPWLIRRLAIPGVGDWASLPLFLLLILVLSFLGDPIGNAYSRFEEHQADVYSLEVTHGLIADPGQAAAQAFQIEGETDLE